MGTPSVARTVPDYHGVVCEANIIYILCSLMYSNSINDYLQIPDTRLLGGQYFEVTTFFKFKTHHYPGHHKGPRVVDVTSNGSALRSTFVLNIIQHLIEGLEPLDVSRLLMKESRIAARPASTFIRSSLQNNNTWNGYLLPFQACSQINYVRLWRPSHHPETRGRLVLRSSFSTALAISVTAHSRDPKYAVPMLSNRPSVHPMIAPRRPAGVMVPLHTNGFGSSITTQTCRVIPEGRLDAWMAPNAAVITSTKIPVNMVPHGLFILISLLSLNLEFTKTRMNRSTVSMTSEIEVTTTVALSQFFCCVAGMSMQPTPLPGLSTTGWKMQFPSSTVRPNGWKMGEHQVACRSLLCWPCTAATKPLICRATAAKNRTKDATMRKDAKTGNSCKGFDCGYASSGFCAMAASAYLCRICWCRKVKTLPTICWSFSCCDEVAVNNSCRCCIPIPSSVSSSVSDK